MNCSPQATTWLSYLRSVWSLPPSSSKRAPRRETFFFSPCSLGNTLHTCSPTATKMVSALYFCSNLECGHNCTMWTLKSCKVEAFRALHTASSDKIFPASSIWPWGETQRKDQAIWASRCLGWFLWENCVVHSIPWLSRTTFLSSSTETTWRKRPDPVAPGH